MRKDNAKIQFSKEEKQKIIEEIQYFFEEEREETLGILASEQIYDFFVNTLGEYAYNKALDDVMVWFKKNMDNIESDFYAIYKS